MEWAAQGEEGWRKDLPPDTRASATIFGEPVEEGGVEMEQEAEVENRGVKRPAEEPAEGEPTEKAPGVESTTTEPEERAEELVSRLPNLGRGQACQTRGSSRSARGCNQTRPHPRP